MGLVLSWNGGQLRHTGHVQTLLNGVDNIYVRGRVLMRLHLVGTRHFKSKEKGSEVKYQLSVYSHVMLLQVINWMQ